MRGSVSYVEAGSDPGRVSDVAHCAQNFGQNAKLTISLSNTRRGRMAIAEDGRMATNIKPAGIGGRGIEPSRHRQDMSLSLWRALSPASFRGREIRPRHDTVADSRVLRLGRWGNQNKPVHLAITHPVKTPSQLPSRGWVEARGRTRITTKRSHPSGDHCASRCHNWLPGDGLPGRSRAVRALGQMAQRQHPMRIGKSPVGDLNDARQPMRKQSQNWASRRFVSGEGGTPFGSREKGSAVAPSISANLYRSPYSVFLQGVEPRPAT